MTDSEHTDGSSERLVATSAPGDLQRSGTRPHATLDEETRLGGQIRSLATLELREERAVWQTKRVAAGHLQVRREVRTRTETVSTELRREVLVITTAPGGPAVYLGDDLLQPGETREIVLYDEQVTLQKVPYVVEEVRIGKRTVTERHDAQVELQREVLVIDEHPPIG